MGSEFREELLGTYHEYDEYSPDAPVQYRAIDPRSVGSVVLGGLSILAYFHWGFLALPLGAIVLGAVGLWQFARVEGASVSVVLSSIGIGLAVVLGGGSYAWSTYLYYTQAPPGYIPIAYETLHSEDPEILIPETAHELDGERVFIRGYMYPGRQQTGIHQFVLSRDNGVCPYCLPQPKPTDLVYVEMIHGLEANYTTHLIGVGGKFTIETDDAKEKYGGVFYHLETDFIR